MKKIKKTWKFWFRRNTDKLECWLEKEAAQGWMPVRLNWGMRCFTFVKGAPRQVAYCLDLLSDMPGRPEAETEEKNGNGYLHLMRNDHWELIGISGAWYLWVKSYTGSRRLREQPDRNAEKKERKKSDFFQQPLQRTA